MMYEVPKPISYIDRGVEVRGNITSWCISDINVEITHPFRGLSDGIHQMYLALQYGGYQDESRAERVALGLLSGLYRIGLKTQRSVRTFRKWLAVYDAEAPLLEARRKEIFEQRIQLRAACRAGQIRQTAYQQRRKDLDLELSKVEVARRELADRCFFRRLPGVVTCGSEESVIEFVGSGKSDALIPESLAS